MSSPPPGPPRYKIAVLAWIAIYPTITVLSWLFGKHQAFRDLPLPVRTFAFSALLVPAMVYVLLPTLTRVFGRWLRRERRPTRRSSG